LITLLAVFAALVCAVWVIYGGAIHSPWIYDDESAVLTNRSIAQLWPLLGEGGNPGPLTPAKNNVTSGRPLVNLTFALNYHFGLLNTTGYHLVSLTLHVLNATLLFAIVRNGLRSTYFVHRYDQVAIGLSFAVALLWSVHPVQTDAVEYISQRTELMMAFFYLSTLFASQRYFSATTAQARGAWLVIAAVACALGAGCKEVMVTAPLLVLLYDRTFETGSLRQAIAKNWPLYAGLLLSWGVIFALNIGGPRAETAGFHLGVNPLTWWFTQAKVFAIYCKLVVWPWPLIIHYHVPYVHTYWSALPWVALTGGLGLLVLNRLQNGTAVGYLGAWIFIILSPTLVVPIITEVAAERRLYLPLAAFVSLGVVALYELVLRVRSAQARSNIVDADSTEAALGTIAGASGAHEPANTQKSPGVSPLAITIACAACVALPLAAVSKVRMQAYQDRITMFADAVKHQPDDPVCTYTLGLYLIQNGREKEAVPHLRRTIELRHEPTPQIDKYLGLALTAAGEFDEAIQRLKRAVDEAPNDLVARRTLGAALLNSGRQDEAIVELERVVQAQPDSVDDIDRLAAALLNANRPDDAISKLQEALRLNPEFYPARFKLAIVRANQGHTQEAIEFGQQALDQARQQGAEEFAAQISGWLNDFRQKSAAPKPATPKSAP